MITTRKQILIFFNIFSFYSYLFWDIIYRDKPALSGIQSDFLFVRANRMFDWVNTLASSGFEFVYSQTENIAIPCYGPITYLLLRPFSLSINFINNISNNGLNFFEDSNHLKIALSLILWVILAFFLIISSSYFLNIAINVLNSKKSRNDGFLLTLITLMSSYPLLFCFDRGNIELITFFLIIVHMYCVIFNENHRKYLSYIEIICLSIAIGMKPYLLLFSIFKPIYKCDHNNIKEILKSIIYTISKILFISISINIISLIFLYRGNIFSGLNDYLYWQNQFKIQYINQGYGDIFFSSPFILIKQSIPNSLYRSEFIKFYPIFTGIISTISLYVSFKFTRGNFRNNITLTTICFTLLLFPYGANEYKCIYLIIPFLLGINSLSKLKDSDSKNCYFFTKYANTISLIFSLAILINRYGLVGNQFLGSTIGSVSVAGYHFSLISLYLLLKFKKVPHGFN